MVKEDEQGKVGRRSVGVKNVKQKRSSRKSEIIKLISLLLLVVVGSVLFVGATSGWFSGEKIVLDEEYCCGEECDGELMNLTTAEYEKLIEEGKSFVVLIDQDGCKTADKLKDYMRKYTVGAGIKAYRMMFSDMKESSLHQSIKYYPSVALINKGKVITYLRADEDEDAGKYNDYDEFKAWIEKWL